MLVATSWKLDRIQNNSSQSGAIIPVSKEHSGHFIIFKGNALLDTFNNCHQQSNVSYRLNNNATTRGISTEAKK